MKPFLSSTQNNPGNLPHNVNLGPIPSGKNSSKSWGTVVAVPFPVYMMKFPNQHNFSKVEFVLHRSSIHSIMVGKFRSRSSGQMLTLPPVREHRGMHASAQLAVSFVCSPGAKSRKGQCPLFRVNLPISLWIISHRMYHSFSSRWVQILSNSQSTVSITVFKWGDHREKRLGYRKVQNRGYSWWPGNGYLVRYASSKCTLLWTPPRKQT